MDVGAVLVREIKLHSDLPPLPEHPLYLTGQDRPQGLSVVVHRLESETLANIACEVRRLKTLDSHVRQAPSLSGGASSKAGSPVAGLSAHSPAEAGAGASANSSRFSFSPSMNRLAIMSAV